MAKVQTQKQSLKGNRVLHSAKKAKQDEFYTQLSDIENELKHFKEQLKGKVVFCNCDDPYESNFFKYFANNFNVLGLKKLIATSYVQSPIVGAQLQLFEIEGLKPTGKEPYKIEINEVPDLNKDSAISLDDVEYLLKHEKNVARPLKGDFKYNAGDFRSTECIELLEQADVIVTNPPFSLFREYVAQLVKYDKKFLIIGSKNAITYKEIFKLIKENKLWLGHGFANGNAYFSIPPDMSREYAKGVYDPNTGLVKFRNVGWFTNLDYKERHDSLTLYKKYTSEEYPKYDNYDAINVNKTAEIPSDYDGPIGVPITFLDVYNPDQFEIMGLTSGREEFEARPIKRYISPKQINRDGSVTSGSKTNTRATLLLSRRPEGIYYTADNVDGYLSIYYARIIVKRKGIQYED